MNKKIRVLISLLLVATIICSLCAITSFADTEAAAETTAAETEAVGETTAADAAEPASDVLDAANPASDVAVANEAGDATAPVADNAVDTAAETEAESSVTWTPLTTSGYIAIVVAAFILVAAVVAVILLAPGKNQKTR